MSKKKVAIVVLDATGSMAGEEKRVVTSVNEYAKALPKGTRLVVFQFDCQRWIQFFEGKVKEWKKMKLSDYQPGSMTPLYDAIAKGISYAKEISSKGDKVHVLIDTDGFENASTEHTLESVQTMIEKRKKKGWAFQFVASGLNTEAAKSVGATGQQLKVSTRIASHSLREAVYVDVAQASAAYLSGEPSDIDEDAEKIYA